MVRRIGQRAGFPYTSPRALHSKAVKLNFYIPGFSKESPGSVKLVRWLWCAVVANGWVPIYIPTGAPGPVRVFVERAVEPDCTRHTLYIPTDARTSELVHGPVPRSSQRVGGPIYIPTGARTSELVHGLVRR